MVLFPFTIDFMRLDTSMIHYVANDILFQRKINFSHLTRRDVATVWLIANKTETNFASEMIQYMLWRKGKEFAYHMVT